MAALPRTACAPFAKAAAKALKQCPKHAPTIKSLLVATAEQAVAPMYARPLRLDPTTRATWATDEPWSAVGGNLLAGDAIPIGE